MMGTEGFAIIFLMSFERRPPFLRRRTDKVLVAIVAGLWGWKILEIVGRQTHLLRRNLGWGYVVDLTISAAATVALALFFIARLIIRLIANGAGRRQN